MNFNFVGVLYFQPETEAYYSPTICYSRVWYALPSSLVYAAVFSFYCLFSQLVLISPTANLWSKQILLLVFNYFPSNSGSGPACVHFNYSPQYCYLPPTQMLVNFGYLDLGRWEEII